MEVQVQSPMSAEDGTQYEHSMAFNDWGMYVLLLPCEAGQNKAALLKVCLV